MSDIERDHQFDSEDERVVDEDLEGGGPVTDVHTDPEASEADVVDQHSEVPLDDD